MSKEDYLKSSYFLDFPVEPFTRVTIAHDLNKIQPEITEFQEKINKILVSHPTYWESSQVVEIDMFPPDYIPKETKGGK